MKDSMFIRGERVPMTKEEVRAVTLSKMDIHTAQHLLDVGAGSGSVSIEAGLINPAISITAIEANEKACEIIKKNIEKFGIKNYEIVHAEAPTEIEDKFDRIFIGGSGGSLESILRWCYGLLTTGGIITANFIVIENAMTAYKLIKESGLYDVEMVQLAVNKIAKMGRYEYFKPVNPVFIIKGVKRK